MNSYLESLSTLLNLLQTQAGGRYALLIHLGAVILVVFVVGKLLARLVFRSDAGYLPVLLSALLPLAIGIATWAAFATWWNPPLFEVASIAVDSATAAAAASALVIGSPLARYLLATSTLKALLFLILVAAASAGGILISAASLTVFGSGAEQVEQSNRRIDLGN